MERYIVAKESYDENPNNDGQESGRRQLYRRTKISPRKALHEISKNELLSPVKKSPSKGILNKNGIKNICTTVFNKEIQFKPLFRIT